MKTTDLTRCERGLFIECSDLLAPQCPINSVKPLAFQHAAVHARHGPSPISMTWFTRPRNGASRGNHLCPKLNFIAVPSTLLLAFPIIICWAGKAMYASSMAECHTLRSPLAHDDLQQSSRSGGSLLINSKKFGTYDKHGECFYCPRRGKMKKKAPIAELLRRFLV